MIYVERITHSLMLISSLCDYSDAYIPVSGTITITAAGTDDAAKRVDEREKRSIFKNCVPFTDCISEINNTQVDNVKHIVLLCCNLMKYNNNYSEKSGSLWKYYGDESNDDITESKSFRIR